MRQRHHRPVLPHPTNMSDQLLLLLLLAKHAEEIGLPRYLEACINPLPPKVWEMDCKEVRQAIAEGADPHQYQKALDLYTRTGDTALFRNLRGVKVTEPRHNDLSGVKRKKRSKL